MTKSLGKRAFSDRLLGIDIGFVSLSVAEINPKRELLKTAYRFHQGNITETLRQILRDFDLRDAEKNNHPN